MHTRILIAAGSAAILGTVAFAGVTHGELDLPFVNQRIVNLEARTTNNESDIKQLQEQTGTAPGEHVDVPPAPSTQAGSGGLSSSGSTSPTPAPTPAPIAAATPAPTVVPTPTPKPLI